MKITSLRTGIQATYTTLDTPIKLCHTNKLLRGTYTNSKYYAKTSFFTNKLRALFEHNEVSKGKDLES